MESQTESRATVAQVANDDVRAGVRNVVGTVVDNSGVTRIKCFPLAKLDGAQRSGIGISHVLPLYLVNDDFATGGPIGGPAGDIRLVPDAESLTPLPLSPSWAWVPFDQYTLANEPSAACQRTALKRMVAVAGERGYSLRMAYELEWFACRANGAGLEPLHVGPGYSANAWAEVQSMADELLAALEYEGISVEQFHPEYAVGQLEVSLPVADPLKAADWNVLLRMTIRTQAANRGFRVSFSPISLIGQVGNGCHIHFSLWNDQGRNMFSGGDEILGLTREGEGFLAGVLAELPAIICLCCPSVLSYHRIQPHRWAGAYACWGHENREAALRFITGIAGSEGRNANMELKSVDATANPYLVPAAVIAAGLAGLDRELRLPAPISEDPGSLSETNLRQLAISRLPQSVDEAVSALEASETLRSALGDLLIDCFLAVRRAESEAFGNMALEELVEHHLWRY